MSKKIKIYTKTVEGTIVDIKNCPILMQSLPTWVEIVKRIQSEDIPILTYVDDNLLEKIDNEIRKAGSGKQKAVLYEIYFQSTLYIPIVLIGNKEGIDNYLAFKIEEEKNKKS